MTAADKSKAAHYGMGVGVILFIMGGMLSCYCAGWFVMTAAVFVMPAVWGSRLFRISGASLCVLSLFAAVVQFREERGLGDKLENLRERRQAALDGCGNHLLAIGVAARLWANDNGNRYPPDLLSLSNEVVTPKVFICPGDHSRKSAKNWASFTPEKSSFEIVTPSLSDGDTNRVFLRCKIHGTVCYADGSVWVEGKRYHKK